jgi:hypothetical protein
MKGRSSRGGDKTLTQLHLRQRRVVLLVLEVLRLARGDPLGRSYGVAGDDRVPARVERFLEVKVLRGTASQKHQSQGSRPQQMIEKKSRGEAGTTLETTGASRTRYESRQPILQFINGLNSL